MIQVKGEENNLEALDSIRDDIDFSSFNVPYWALKERLESIPNARAAALFATIYAGYARVGEIVRGRYNDNPPTNKSQIEETPTHIILTILTEKTGQWRRVPTSIAKEGWLHFLIFRWWKRCGFELFPYSTRWAEEQFKKYFGIHRIHLLRHWGTTHALQGHRTKQRLQPQYVARLGGWTDLNTFYKTYSHFIVEDFIELI